MFVVYIQQQQKNGDLHRILKLWFNLKISRQQYTLHEYIVDLFVCFNCLIHWNK